MVLTADDPTPALQSPVALTRAAAARVAAVRDLKASLPALRAAFDGESDPVARREELRALVLLGDEPDVDRALEVAKNDTGMMIALTDAVARRDDALDLYEKKLQPAGVPLSAAFLKQSVWQRPGRLALSGSRFIALHDAAGWSSLLSLVCNARVIMTPGVVAASLNVPSEEMRTRSIWYLVYTFAPDPSKLDPLVRDILTAPKEEPSLREAFGRELLGRMLGGERKGDSRFVSWLQTTEADDVIRSEEALFQYFTDEEFFTRKKHCGQATYECRMPAAPGGGKSVGIQAVTPPPYMLPGLLPPGLTDAILHETRCTDAWLHGPRPGCRHRAAPVDVAPLRAGREGADAALSRHSGQPSLPARHTEHHPRPRRRADPLPRRNRSLRGAGNGERRLRPYHAAKEGETGRAGLSGERPPQHALRRLLARDRPVCGLARRLRTQHPAPGAVTVPAAEHRDRPGARPVEVRARPPRR